MSKSIVVISLNISDHSMFSSQESLVIRKLDLGFYGWDWGLGQGALKSYTVITNSQLGGIFSFSYAIQYSSCTPVVFFIYLFFFFFFFYSVRPQRWQPTRLLCPWDSPGKNTEWVAISFSVYIFLCIFLIVVSEESKEWK